MTEAPGCGRVDVASGPVSDDANTPMYEDCRDVVRRQGVVDRERELESLAGVRKRVVIRQRLTELVVA